jgi:hypothetical protein
MNQYKAPPIDAIDFRVDCYSADNKNIIVSLATKYSAERRIYSVPVACLSDFVADLKKLKPPSPTDAAATSGEPATTRISEPAPAPVAKDPNRINVTVPKKWMLRSGLPQRPLVIMVFDPQTEAQAGFALPEAAAREMAAGLVKYADALVKHEASKPKPT